MISIKFNHAVLLTFLMSINPFGIKAHAGNSLQKTHQVVNKEEKSTHTINQNGNGFAFTPNKGQIIDMSGNLRPDILYKGNGAGANIYLRKTGISYVQSNLKEVMHEIDEQIEELEHTVHFDKLSSQHKKEELMRERNIKIHRVDMDFEGANTNYRITNENEVDGFENFYYPHCPDGITGVKQYNNVTYKNIYKNIDVAFYGGKDKGLKYDLVVQPHGDPSQIKLHWKGAEELKITNGKLIIKTSVNEFYESIPKVYQNINGKIVDVKTEYKLDMRCEMLEMREKNERSKSHISCLKSHVYEVTFSFNNYNSAFPLVIDPWATYYSGSDMQSGGGLCTDGTGNAIVTGYTIAPNFPVSPGATQSVFGGGSSGDAFLLKFSITGTRIFATYYGGSSIDYGYGVVADNNNDILLCGMSISANFPTKDPGAGAYYQPAAAGGGGSAFVAKFTPTGLLTWSTLYSGTGGTYNSSAAYDVTSDAANNVIFVGEAGSNSFPVQAPFQASYNGGSRDAFVVKFNTNCVRQWATFYGGNAEDYAIGVDCDAANNIFFTGLTNSPNFPVIAAFQAAPGSNNDAFVAKLNGATGFPLWSTYYGGVGYSGGGGQDIGIGIVIDTLGNCIVSGITSSNNNIASAGANQISNSSGNDAFIVKLNSTGTRLWGTFHGLNYSIYGSTCTTDSKNNIYWYGEIEESEPAPGWISACAYQSTFGGTEDQFISKFDPNGKLICTTAIGGPGEDDLDEFKHVDIAAYDPYLYITGRTQGGSYPVTPGAFQTISTGAYSEVFVNQLCMNICQQKNLNINVNPATTVICSNTPVTFHSSVDNACDTTGTKLKWTFTGGTPVTSTAPNPSVTYTAPGNYNVKLVVTTPCQKDSIIKSNYIIVNPCTSTLGLSATTASVCRNGCANISASGTGGASPYTYSWSNGQTTSVINVCSATTTDYTVKVTDAAGNYSLTTTSLIVNSPSVSTNFANIYCNASNGYASVTVNSGTGPYTYQWSNGATSFINQNTAYIQNLTAGGYTLTLTDSNGCSITKTYTILDVSPLNAEFTYAQACVGVPVNFTNTGTPPGSGITYLWTISTTAVSGTTTNFSYTFLSPGTYTVTHKVTGNGCAGSVIKTITVSTNCNSPTVTTSGSSICSGSCATITSSGSGGVPPYTYSWSSNETTQNINSCPVSTATYTVTIKDSGGNTSTSSAIVTINPSVVTSTTPTNISCNGSSNASIIGSASGGSSGFTYSWSNGNSGSAISGLSQGTYILTVTDSKNCTSTSVATITSPTPLIGQFTKGTAICAGCGCKEWIMISASGGTGPYSYSWPDGYVNRYKNQLCPGAYTINIKDKNGCSVILNLSVP